MLFEFFNYEFSTKSFPKNFMKLFEVQNFIIILAPLCIATVAMLVQIDTSFGDPWNVKRTLNSVCEL